MINPTIWKEYQMPYNIDDRTGSTLELMIVNKIRLFKHFLKENGLKWMAWFLLEKTTGRFTDAFRRKRIDLEIRERLPGFNTTVYNYRGWSRYNWSGEGEEWNDSEEWKSTLISEVLLKYIKPHGTVLEIGPGAGRWSDVLAGISSNLILVDITEVSLELCRKKLAGYSHCHYFQNNGRDLLFLENGSLDYVWSFGVFVHIAPDDTERYIQELGRVMKKGGLAIIHHPAEGGHLGGFRSSVTNDFFSRILASNDFKILKQISRWGESDRFSVDAFKDMITVFTKA
jgi:ubiquinone/menaquinone biosynthesis C-methylase UbiE